MFAANIPPKFPIPFAGAAGSADIRPIPVASQISIKPGAASLTDGFPPLNFIFTDAGGIPPFGEDMNGILNQITLWNRWHAAGGPLKFDATFAAAIAGYPAGALVQSNSGHAIYESLQDNNTSDPNTGSPLWAISSCVWSSAAAQAAGSANIQTITLTPAPTSLAQLVGIPLLIISQGTNTGTVTVNPNGLGAVPLQAPGGVPLGGGALVTGAPFIATYTGSTFIQLAYSNVFASLVDNGPLTVGGVATLHSLVVSASSQLQSTLTVAGVTQLEANLGVAGPTNLQSSLVAAGSVLCQSTLGVAGGAIFQSTMGVTGQFVCQSAVTAQAFNTTSDYRIKVTFGFADVGELIDYVPVYDGEFINGDGHRRPMFLAHELAEVAPHAVRGVKDATNDDGSPALQTVDHQSLVPYLWAEIKALRARVAALEDVPNGLAARG